MEKSKQGGLGRTKMKVYEKAIWKRTTLQTNLKMYLLKERECKGRFSARLEKAVPEAKSYYKNPGAREGMPP